MRAVQIYAVRVGPDAVVPGVVVCQGFETIGSPLGPVHWRIEERGAQRMYCSTYREKRPNLERASAAFPNVRAFLDQHPEQDEFTVVIETLL